MQALNRDVRAVKQDVRGPTYRDEMARRVAEEAEGSGGERFEAGPSAVLFDIFWERNNETGNSVGKKGKTILDYSSLLRRCFTALNRGLFNGMCIGVGSEKFSFA